MKAKPFCAVCGKLVDSFIEEQGELDVVWTARCHGDSERIRMRLDDLRNSKVTGFSLAFAKSPRRLPFMP